MGGEYVSEFWPVLGIMLSDCSVLWDHLPRGLVNYYISGLVGWGKEEDFIFYPFLSFQVLFLSTLSLPHFRLGKYGSLMSLETIISHQLQRGTLGLKGRDGIVRHEVSAVSLLQRNWFYRDQAWSGMLAKSLRDNKAERILNGAKAVSEKIS